MLQRCGRVGFLLLLFRIVIQHIHRGLRESWHHIHLGIHHRIALHRSSRACRTLHGHRHILHSSAWVHHGHVHPRVHAHHCAGVHVHVRMSWNHHCGHGRLHVACHDHVLSIAIPGISKTGPLVASGKKPCHGFCNYRQLCSCSNGTSNRTLEQLRQTQLTIENEATLQDVQLTRESSEKHRAPYLLQPFRAVLVRTVLAETSELVSIVLVPLPNLTFGFAQPFWALV